MGGGGGGIRSGGGRVGGRVKESEGEGEKGLVELVSWRKEVLNERGRGERWIEYCVFIHEKKDR